nr:proline-rich protein 2-like [Bubalus bubalis]
MSFPKETLRLCKQAKTTQSPAEHLALPDPPGLSPSGSQPATGRGSGVLSPPAPGESKQRLGQRPLPPSGARRGAATRGRAGASHLARPTRSSRDPSSGLLQEVRSRPIKPGSPLGSGVPASSSPREAEAARPGTASRVQPPGQAQHRDKRPPSPRPRGHAPRGAPPPARPPPPAAVALRRGPGLPAPAPARWRRRRGGLAPRLRVCLARVSLGESAAPRGPSPATPRPLQPRLAPLPRCSPRARPRLASRPPCRRATLRLGGRHLLPTPLHPARALPLRLPGPTRGAPPLRQGQGPAAPRPPAPPRSQHWGRQGLFVSAAGRGAPSRRLAECHPRPPRALSPPPGVHPDQVAAGAF